MESNVLRKNETREYHKSLIRNEIDKFVKFINKMKEDYFYIGCEYGTYQTTDALMLNGFFNPNQENVRADVRMSSFIHMMDLISQKLLPEDKVNLGWTKEYEQIFKNKICRR